MYNSTSYLPTTPNHTATTSPTHMYQHVLLVLLLLTTTAPTIPRSLTSACLCESCCRGRWWSRGGWEWPPTLRLSRWETTSSRSPGVIIMSFQSYQVLFNKNTNLLREVGTPGACNGHVSLHCHTAMTADSSYDGQVSHEVCDAAEILSKHPISETSLAKFPPTEYLQPTYFSWKWDNIIKLPCSV